MRLSGLLLCLFACSALAQDVPQDVKNSEHALGEKGTVTVKLVVGGITVRAGEGEKTRLKITKRGRDLAKVDVQVSVKDGALLVKGKWSEDDDVQAEVHVEVTLAAQCAGLKCTLVSGPVDVEGARAPVKINVINGAVRVARVRGDVSVQTVSGNVRCTDVVGTKVSLVTVSGRIKGAIAATKVRVESVSGALAVGVAPPAEGKWSVDAKSISGALSIGLPASAGATVAARSLSGAVACDFMPGKVIRPRVGPGRRIRGTFGDGRGKITMSTISGALTISKRK